MPTPVEYAAVIVAAAIAITFIAGLLIMVIKRPVSRSLGYLDPTADYASSTGEQFWRERGIL